MAVRGGLKAPPHVRGVSSGRHKLGRGRRTGGLCDVAGSKRTIPRTGSVSTAAGFPTWPGHLGALSWSIPLVEDHSDLNVGTERQDETWRTSRWAFSTFEAYYSILTLYCARSIVTRSGHRCLSTRLSRSLGKLRREKKTLATSITTTLRTVFTIDVEALNDDRRDQLRKVIDSALRRFAEPDGDDLVLGWTRTSLQSALERLEREGNGAQAEAIRAALRNDGYVTRAQIYKIAHYKKDRTLRGFTRPTNRTVLAMRNAGELPPDAIDLLMPSYQDGPVADGFRVPAELAQLLQ